MTNKPVPPSSPIMSYFFGKDSLSKPLATTKPAASTGPPLPPLPDEDDEFTPDGKSTPKLGHNRAMSMGSWSRFPASPITGSSSMAGSNVPPNSPQDTVQRGAGVLRRLSLGAAFARVSPCLLHVSATPTPWLPSLSCCYMLMLIAGPSPLDLFVINQPHSLTPHLLRPGPHHARKFLIDGVPQIHV